MGALPPLLVRDLKELLALGRAVETGTYEGAGTRVLAKLFPEVVTIELSAELYARANRVLSDLPSVLVLHGDSVVELRALARDVRPTLYWLDGHWSGGETAGENHECPVLGELNAIGPGHADDCVLIDDARLFMAPPPPPCDPQQWPVLLDVLDAIRRHRPHHHVTVAHDIVIAVPQRAKSVVDRFGQQGPTSSWSLPRRIAYNGLTRILRRLERQKIK